jgi:hypothetical protein
VDDPAEKGYVMRVPVLQILCICLVTVFIPFGDTEAQIREHFLPGSTTEKYAVIFGGAASGKIYEEQFREWALNLHEILAEDYGYRPDQITLLLGRGDSEESRISGPCRRETILETMTNLQKKVQAGDQVSFFFIGHGTSDEENAKFVIVGPDITGDKFADLLKRFLAQDIIVVNTTISSYPFCAALPAPGRVVICATRSGAERYDTVFPRFFLRALDDHAGDRDKNKRLSMFEAFLFAREKVKNWYTDQDRLPSEHPTLDDNGDGRFYTDPNPAKGEGRVAQIAYLETLTVSSPEIMAGGPESEALRKLTAKTLELERSVFLLRNQKDELAVEEYRQQMEALLIELARTTRKLKTLRAGLRAGQ